MTFHKDTYGVPAFHGAGGNPGPPRKTSGLIYKWMKGAAATGGITSRDLAEDFGMPLQTASAFLGSLAFTGRIARIGKQLVMMEDCEVYSNMFYTLYVRCDELEKT